MARPDISPHLIHFTKGENEEAAFRNLQKIIRERRLMGSGRLIRGGYSCVCFSEAPVSSLSKGLLNEANFSRYALFGIMVSKQWLFALGGRPVIYQPDNEYDTLTDAHRWRHMRFEIGQTAPAIDFTWEREWRIRCESLPFDQRTARLVVPDRRWAQRLKREHEDDQHYTVQMYSVIMGDIAEAHRESFNWEVRALR